MYITHLWLSPPPSVNIFTACVMSASRIAGMWWDPFFPLPAHFLSVPLAATQHQSMRDTAQCLTVGKLFVS